MLVLNLDPVVMLLGLDVWMRGLELCLDIVHYYRYLYYYEVQYIGSYRLPAIPNCVARRTATSHHTASSTGVPRRGAAGRRRRKRSEDPEHIITITISQSSVRRHRRTVNSRLPAGRELLFFV